MTSSRAPAGGVTVVIPTRNRPDLVRRSVWSALAQEHVPTSVVVVDDGSGPQAARLVSRLAGPRVRIVRHATSRGVSGARNAGLARVGTPWVAFLDDDDYWLPEKLSDQLDALHRTPGAGWSCVGAVHVDAASRPTYWRAPPPSEETLDLLSRVGGIPGGGSGVLVSTRLARDAGGFDPSFSILADWDFYFRLARRSPVATVNRPLVGYFIHSDSLYHDPVNLARELRALELKHRDSRPPLQPDYSFWTLQLIAMALRARDRRALQQIVRGGILRRTTLPALLAVVAGRLRGEARLGNRTCPPHWRGESLAWLDGGGACSHGRLPS